MISRTSKSSVILGPIIGQILANRPRICGLYYTKLLQRLLESIWEHHGKYYIWKYENQNIRKNGTCVYPTF